MHKSVDIDELKTHLSLSAVYASVYIKCNKKPLAISKKKVIPVRIPLLFFLKNIFYCLVATVVAIPSMGKLTPKYSPCPVMIIL